MENNYETLRMPELKALARERRLRGYSRLRKAELIAFLQDKDRRQEEPTQQPELEVLQSLAVEIRTWGFWCSFRPLLHHTSSAHHSHSVPELLSLSNCIRLWGN